MTGHAREDDQQRERPLFEPLLRAERQEISRRQSERALTEKAVVEICAEFSWGTEGLIEFIRTSAGAAGPRLPASLPGKKRLLDKLLKEKTRLASETTARATPQAVWLPLFTR